MEPKKKTRRKRCNRCGLLKPKEDVTYIANPYLEDIEDIVVMENLCTSCYNELCYEI